MFIRHHSFAVCVLLACLTGCAGYARAQAYGQLDREAPGDAMIQKYLQIETAKLAARFAEDVASRQAWESNRPRYMQEYFYMLGLSPMPEKTPLRATITGTFQGNGFVVDKLHFQSRPGLYVTANLYRPATARVGDKLPAILYVCGHANRGRDGNKVAYQSNAIWFARHGYLCLMLDTLQLGEIAAVHHGTYRMERWWWHSRGYTPAGVEAWNGIRAIDYLVGRNDVDAHRIAVTGISGGGAATYWIAAADPRVAVAVPISGMADLESYVPNRVINGHCDCMFLNNTFRWPWTRIAALIAPRPLLFVNSDQDSIFPMDANDRVINRLERLYSLYGASDRVDAIVSIGGHAYRQDIRQAVYRFINAHLKGDSRPIEDSEIDLVVTQDGKPIHPIPPEKLRVFPTDADIPEDQLNTTIDERFVPMASVPGPEPGQLDGWKQPLLAELKRVSFGYFPNDIPPAKKLRDVEATSEQLQSEEAIEFRIRFASPMRAEAAKSILLVVLNQDEAGTTPSWTQKLAANGQVIVFCEPRGIGATRWTRKNPPNYVERSHVLVGRTVDAGRVWDVIAAARYAATHPAVGGDRSPRPVRVAGHGAASLVAAYAAALDARIAGATLLAPPATHMDNGAPQLLNVLRVCDVPDALGLVAPRPLRIVDSDPARFTHTAAAYLAAGAKEAISFE